MPLTIPDFDKVQAVTTRVSKLERLKGLDEAQIQAIRAAYWLLVSVAEHDADPTADFAKGSLLLARQCVIESLAAVKPAENKGLHKGPCHTDDCACWMDR